jgi:hypothetical protein
MATSICAALMGLGWEVGTLFATFAMAGDLFSSFVKRRLHVKSSKKGGRFGQLRASQPLNNGYVGTASTLTHGLETVA